MVFNQSVMYIINKYVKIKWYIYIYIYIYIYYIICIYACMYVYGYTDR